MSRLKKLLGVIGLFLVLFLNGFAYADGLIRTFKGHNKNVNSVAFSPDGTMIVSGSNDDTIKLWDRKSGKLLNIIKGHKEAVKIVAFSPNGTMIASGSWDKTIKLWDTESGRLLNTINAKYRASSSLVFSPDGTIIAFSDYQILKLWDIQNNKLLKPINGVGGMFEDLSSIAFSPDGTKIALGGSRSSIKLWDMHSPKRLKTIRRNTLDFNQEDVDGIAFSPDGSMIASGGRSIKLWNVQSGRLLKELKSSKLISSIAFGSDGAMIVSGSWDRTIKLRDIQSGRVFSILKGHKDRVNSIAISPDGTMIISGSSDNTVKLWDISPTNEKLARKVYKSIDKSDYAILYAFTKKFYNHLDIVQQAYRDMNKELIRIHQKAYDKAKEIDTVSAYNTFVFAYPYASQAKEANERAYELEKEHYTDIGMLGFFSKDEKMNKQARNLLIEAQRILDIDKNARMIDTGYYMVVDRMYELAKREFANTDRVLTLKESPELKKFNKTLQQKLQGQTDNIKKIESGSMGGVIELRVDSTKAVMLLESSDSKMKELYLEENQKSKNFEILYQKVLIEYKHESKMAQRSGMEKATKISQVQREKVREVSTKKVSVFKEGQVWRGWYICQQGKTAFDLIIKKVTENEIKAIFDFNYKNGRAIGQLELSGSYSPYTKKLEFRPIKWLNNPNGYGLVGMSGEINEDRNFVGQITGSGCTDFEVVLLEKKSDPKTKFMPLESKNVDTEETINKAIDRNQAENSNSLQKKGVDTLSDSSNTDYTRIKRKESNPLKFSNENDKVNSNSSLVSKQKDQQHTQPYKPTNNQLTDAERQELEQLRAEKAKAAQEKEANSVVGSDSISKPKTIEVERMASEVVTSEPVNQNQTGHSNSIQNTRADSRTDGSKTYYARISQRDHYGKSGQKLKGVGIILQQDRANYHKYHKRDREDTGDNRFDTRGNRNKIKRMLAKGSTSQKTLDAIRYGTPLVKVKIYPEYIDVTLESGGGQTQQRQQKKNSAQPRQNKSKKSKCNTDGSIRGISSRGDGFVAVRKGPGTKYGMIGKIYRNGTRVQVCDRKGKWKGIIYGDCILGSSRSRNGSCKAGWIYEKYIRIR